MFTEIIGYVGMIPIVIMNLAIVIIDIYYLIQILASEKTNK